MVIYTVTLNPCIDRYFNVGEIVFDDINRIEKSRIDAGGKGVNVAIMLKKLGCECAVISVAGGFNGKTFKELLSKEDVKCFYSEIEGNVRDVFNFAGENGMLRFNEKGPLLTLREQERFLSVFDAIDFEKKDFIVISGSLPPGVDKKIYAGIISKAKKKSLTTVLDTDGEALVEGLSAVPHIIKPNIWEIERIAGKRIISGEELYGAFLDITEAGVSKILLTLGCQGAVLFNGRDILHASVPNVKVESTVGCGDAFLAGYLQKLSMGRTEPDCLRFAASAGTAKAGEEGTLMPGIKAISDVYGRTIVKKIKPEELKEFVKIKR